MPVKQINKSKKTDGNKEEREGKGKKRVAGSGVEKSINYSKCDILICE